MNSNKNAAFLIVGLSVLIAVCVQPFVGAQSGTPPTLDWTITYTKSLVSVDVTGVPYDHVRGGQLSTAGNGRVGIVFQLENGAGSDFDAQLRILTTTGAYVSQTDHRCERRAGADVCEVIPNAVDFDRSDRLSFVRRKTHATGGPDWPENQLCYVQPNGQACGTPGNSSVVSGTRQLSDVTTPTFTGLVEALDTYQLNSSAFSYTLGGGLPDALIRYGTNFSDDADYANSGVAAHVRANNSGDIGWSQRRSGAPQRHDMRRWNFTSGTITNTNVGIGEEVSCSGDRIRVLTNATNRLITVYSSTTSGRSVRWNIVRQSDVGTVSSAVAPSNDQINDGGLRSTCAANFDVDGAGNLLVCGWYEVGAETRGFVAHYKTSTNAMHWNVTLDLGSQTTGTDCKFDFLGGFYVSFNFDDGLGQGNKIQVRHYIGGDFTTPTRRAFVALPAEVTPTPTPGINSDALEGFKNFATGIGFISAGSKIFWGIIFVVAGTITVGAITFRLMGPTSLPYLCAITATALSAVCVFAEWWPVWILVFMALISAGFVTWIVRGAFVGRGG